MACAECQAEEFVAIVIRQKTPVLPWHDGPRHLVSWWDMNKFDAGNYLAIAANLGALSADFAKNPQYPMSQQNIQTFQGQLSDRAQECRELGLAVSGRQFEMAAENLAGMPASGVLLFIQASTIIIELQNAMISEMDTHLFLSIECSKAKYYEQEELFGAKVATNFKSTSRDVRAAGNCYASDNNTACVFHCMRVLEKGLHTFADHLGISFVVPVELQNWQNIIDPIEKVITHREKTLSKGTAKADELKFLSGAAAQFRYFKEAWRNHVTHSRVTYDDIEALRIMSHVHQFMDELAKYGLKEP